MLSKVFTSTILANFVIDEKINLNDNINGYLKTSFNNNTEISFINLANHTSGLPPLPSNLDLTKVNPENPYKEYKEKELEEYLTKHLELLNKEKYQYSNFHNNDNKYFEIMFTPNLGIDTSNSLHFYETQSQ